MAKKREESRTCSTALGRVYGAEAKRSPVVGSSSRMCVVIVDAGLESSGEEEGEGEERVGEGDEDGMAVSRMRRRAVKIWREGALGEEEVQ